MVSSLSQANILNTTATQVKAQKDDVAKLVKYVIYVHKNPQNY